MKLRIRNTWYEPSYVYDTGFFAKIEGIEVKILVNTGDEIYTDLPVLHKIRDGGNLMEFSWKIVRTSDLVGFNIVGTITEAGRKDRVFTSAVSTKTNKLLMVAALDSLKARWQKKQDRDGWWIGNEVETIREPMLLHRWEDAKKRSGPWLVSPKLDGIRGTYNPESHEMISRKRNPFALPHICGQLKRLGVAADGELWHPRHDWETISGTVSRDSDDSSSALLKGDLQFHIFDRADMPDVPYVERLASLIDLDLSGCPNLFIVPSIYCETEEDVWVVYKRLVDSKYEGAVARTLTGLYKNDSRSWEVLKMKPMHSKEFKLKAISYDTDPTWGKLISYILIADNGATFKSTPAKSKEERSKDYLVLNSMPILDDTYVTVEYRDTYRSGIPKFSVVKGIRNTKTW